MARGRYTFSTTNRAMIEHLAKQKNVSRYVRRLIEADMGPGGGSGPVSPSSTTNQAEVLAAILAELQQINRKLDSGAGGERSPATRREPSEGLRRQVGKFRRATLPKEKVS